MRRISICLAVVLFVSLSAFAQQNYVGRFDTFGGFSYLAEPKINLMERGFNGQTGVNVNRWLALGVDYNIFYGHSTLTPSALTVANQQKLAPLLPLLGGKQLAVPFDSTTWTFAAGPQVNIRKFKTVTIFVRPVLGVMHETVQMRTDRISDPQVKAVADIAVGGLLGATTKKDDTATFYGFGGGMDFNVSKHIALRTQADYVHVFLFEGTLKESRNAARVSFGPTFRFGRNVQ